MNISGLEAFIGLLLLGSAAHGFNCGFNDSYAEQEELNQEDRTAHESNSAYRWNKNDEGKTIVPYFWNDGVTPETKTVIKKIFDEFENKACISFVEENQRESKKQLRIDISGNTCSRWSCSTSGSVGGRSPMVLWMDRPPGVFLWHRRLFDHVFKHEVFHVFGITHTQRRKDRDDYVQMNWDNIIYGKDNYQYQKCEHCKVPEGVPYECNSIMHYEQDTYKKMNKGPTMYGKKAGAPNFCSKNFQVSREPTANDWLSLNVRLGCNKN